MPAFERGNHDEAQQRRLSIPRIHHVKDPPEWFEQSVRLCEQRNAHVQQLREEISSPKRGRHAVPAAGGGDGDGPRDRQPSGAAAAPRSLRPPSSVQQRRERPGIWALSPQGSPRGSPRAGAAPAALRTPRRGQDGQREAPQSAATSPRGRGILRFPGRESAARREGAARHVTLSRCPWAVEHDDWDQGQPGEGAKVDMTPPAGMTGEEAEEARFAWWSQHWAGVMSGREAKRRPIRPVEKIWLGNFQKRLVPWRKEQLGSSPSWSDFPWPPAPDEAGVDEAVARSMERATPYGLDRTRFAGPGEATLNSVVQQAKHPDFLQRTGDLSNRDSVDLSASAGNTARPRGAVGWTGWRQAEHADRYDTMGRRLYRSNGERLLGLIADKLVEHQVQNFYLAFARFDADKSGYIDADELRRFLGRYNIILEEEQIQEILDMFDTPQGIGYADFVRAIDEVGRGHPLVKHKWGSGEQASD